MLPDKPVFAHITAWGTKFAECLLAYIALLNVLGTAIEFLPRNMLNAAEQWIEVFLVYGQLLLPLLLALIVSIYWQRRQQKGVDAAPRHARLRGIIRFWLAFEIATYGFAKIMGTQFFTPVYRMDVPLGEVSGFALTWYYFGYSRALAVIIALFQIGGAAMLLFRRTTLLGAILLLPVMMNIVFINLFFNISTGAFINSVLFTVSLCYIIWLDRYLLANLLTRSYQGLPAFIKPWWQWVLRIGVMVAAAGLIYSLGMDQKAEKTLSGKWMVQSYIAGADIIGADQWLHDSTAWKVLYFNGMGGQAAFCPNPYVYEMAKSARGEYEYEEATKKLRIIFYNNKNEPSDSIKGTATVLQDTTLHITALHGSTSISIKAVLKKKK